MLLDICLPIKDEELILEDNALRLHSYLDSLTLDHDWRIVLIVNGSSDKTYEIAEKLKKTDETHFEVINIVSSGKGLALKTYFKESRADILSFMDSDLSVSLEDIPSLIEPILENEVDIVIGSRLLPGSKTSRSKIRDFTSRQYNKLSDYLFGHGLKDLQCGFKAFKNNVFQDLHFLLRDDKWFFDTEFVILAHYFKYKIKEIPVDWQENRYHERKSKVKNIEAYRFVKKLFEFKRYLKTIENKNVN